MAQQQPIDPLQLILAIINSKNSNSSDIKNLFDPQLANLLGTGAPTVTDQQIEMQYMPTWNSVKNAPVGSIEQRIATDIANGLSPFTIKQDIRKANIQLLPGETYGTYDKLVEQLFKEQVDANNKKFERDQTAAKESGGLPDAKLQYDPKQLYPDVFGKLQGNIDKTQTETTAKLKAMQDKYDASNKASMPVAGKLPTDEQLRSKLTPSVIKFMGIKGSPKNALEKTYFENAMKNAIEGEKAKFAKLPQTEKMNYANDIPKTHDQLMKDAAFAYQQELAGAPAKTIGDNPLAAAQQGQVWDSKLKAFRAPAAGEFGTTVNRIPAVNLRDPVWQQQQLMGLVSEAISQQLQQQGRTPRNDELLKRAIMFKQMGK
jgi:hypothetical protein